MLSALSLTEPSAHVETRLQLRLRHRIHRSGALRRIQPGKADQNAFIEPFNKTHRDEVLDAYVFGTIEQVRWISDI